MHHFWIKFSKLLGPQTPPTTLPPPYSKLWIRHCSATVSSITLASRFYTHICKLWHKKLQMVLECIYAILLLNR